MGKAPALQFYAGDYLSDPALGQCSPHARGIWMDMLMNMFLNDRSGQLAGTYESLARICRSTVDEMRAAIEELGTTNTADVTIGHENVTVRNRRMYRDWVERKNAAKRKRKERSQAPGQRGSSGEGVEAHNVVTEKSRPYSSSSSSSSPSSSMHIKAEPPENGGPPPGRKRERKRPTEEEHRELARLIEFFKRRSMRDPDFDFNAAQFMGQRVMKPPAVVIAALTALERAVKAGTVLIKGPWAYATDVFDKECQQYNARLSEAEHEERIRMVTERL